MPINIDNKLKNKIKCDPKDPCCYDHICINHRVYAVIFNAYMKSEMEKQKCSQHIVNQDYALEAIELAFDGYEPTDAEIYDQIPVIKRVQAKIEQMKQWINDLQSGMYINCIYCGHRYGPALSTPASMADCLKEHIEKCPMHPMSKLKANNAVLLDACKSAVAVIKKGDAFGSINTTGLSRITPGIKTGPALNILPELQAAITIAEAKS